MAFLIVVLSISIVGLILLLSFKRYEMNTGRVLFARSRTIIEKPLHTSSWVVEHVLPLLARRSLAHSMRALRASFGHLVARITLMVEHVLHRLLGVLHRVVEPRHEGGQASLFLQEVAEHKRKLLRRGGEKRAIFDES